MPTDRFLDAAWAEVRKRRLAQFDAQGVICFEAIAPHALDVDYDNRAARWVEGGFLHERVGSFLLMRDRRVVLIPDIEADECFRLRFNVEQPAELAEFIEFYRQARQVIARPVAMKSVSIAEVIAEAALVLRIGSKWRLLPVSVDTLGRLPRELVRILERHLAGGDTHGLTGWDHLGDQWARIIKPLTRPVVGSFAYWGPVTRLRPAYAGEADDQDFYQPKVWLRPCQEGLSWIFWGEYFRYTAEGHAALEQLWGGGTMAGLARRLRSIRIMVPKDRNQQIRRGLEWRSARLAAIERVAEMVGAGTPATRRAQHLAGILGRLDDSGRL